ncbi:hypothetical protein CU098_010340 [Rhizopus stolonifer]|uniref:FAS1 domain-containing protein n=1 Tax=Rhizopus stolonifer TaxID=4846 RepID=A0A367K6I1_RHIST|nr:hypothetical protein CU098_010340 [Rhizopus stolonifer]
MIYTIDQFLLPSLSPLDTISILNETEQMEELLKSLNLSDIISGELKTILIPNNQALAQLLPFGTLLHDLEYLVLDGLYMSHQLMNTTIQTAFGPLYFSYHHVTNQRQTARLVRTDILTTTGVIHIIDHASEARLRVDGERGNLAATEATTPKKLWGRHRVLTSCSSFPCFLRLLQIVGSCYAVIITVIAIAITAVITIAVITIIIIVATGVIIATTVITATVITIAVVITATVITIAVITTAAITTAAITTAIIIIIVIVAAGVIIIVVAITIIIITTIGVAVTVLVTASTFGRRREYGYWRRICSSSDLRR